MNINGVNRNGWVGGQLNDEKVGGGGAMNLNNNEIS